MNIAVAVKEDYPEIVDVWEASVRATHDFLSEDDIRFFKPLILNEYLSAVELYCVKDEAERIHGFVGVAGQKIEMLFLAPRRGRGLGKLLLNFAVTELGPARLTSTNRIPPPPASTNTWASRSQTAPRSMEWGNRFLFCIWRGSRFDSMLSKAEQALARNCKGLFCLGIIV
ncbi:hypothetical protein [Pseudodesulfovibrio tunisiensis]|uniref:hypothetical protein n=1 Tax=Pseudodesulfovibrio tunisiensis TaxID=463192 RepID=UPI00311D4E30